MTRKSTCLSFLIQVASRECLRISFSMQGFYACFECRGVGIHYVFGGQEGRLRQGDYPQNGNFTCYDSTNK